MQEKIEIPLNKKKILLLTGGAILFVLLGLWLFFTADDLQRQSSPSPIFIKGIAIVAILFFAIAAIVSVKKLFVQEVGLIIDARGIVDNSSALSIGLIAWNDIIDTATVQVMSTTILLIKVANPEQYIARAGSGLQAKLLHTNREKYGTPIAIATNTLKCDIENLKRLIHQALADNKNVD